MVSVTTGSWAGDDAAGTFDVDNITGPMTVSEQLVSSDGLTVYATSMDSQTIAQETARALIAAVPGSGPIRGVWVYNDVLYAFRDNLGATACLGYKATASGWAAVALLSFTAGGKYRFVNANFTGSATGEKMYFCNTVDKAQEWDGTTLTALTTGLTPDTPVHIAFHRNYLFLSFEAYLQNSDKGDPAAWTGTAGAVGRNVGSVITGLKPLKGGILGIFSEDKVNLLQGDGSTDKPWYMSEHGSHIGARQETIQTLSDTYFLDRMGITNLQATQAFGDFADSEVSHDVRPYVQSLLGKEVGSVAIRGTSLMRTFFDNGTGTEFVTIGLGGGKVRGITRGSYPFNLECIKSVEIAGYERIFAGDDSGFVYEMEVGTNFDGAAILAILRLAFNHLKSPSMLKAWRALWLDVKAEASQTLTFTVEQDYGDEDKPEVAYSENVLGIGGYWGSVVWDEFAWSGQPVFPARAPLNGIGYNMGIIVSTETIYDSVYSLMGAMIHYSPRRMLR